MTDGRLDERGLPALRLAALMIRFRLRFLRNGLRARTGGRFPTLVVIVGLFTSASYVGLFANAFSLLCEHADVAGQVAALAVVAMTIAFGSFTAKAASSEAVLAGSPENEFLLARPVALPTLVVARCLAEAATDPVGALFLLPILVGAVHTWHLPAPALLLAAVVSLLVQIGISALAQATQISVVRFVPRARRRTAWMVLRLVAALALAALWMMGLRVLRAPATLAEHLAHFVPFIGFTPGPLIVGPLGALARHDLGGMFGALVALAGTVLATTAFAAFVARRAGMSGWEEAGATWTDASARPRAASSRPLTAATKDLTLITRDRAQLVALVSMPVIFVGVQLVGAAGWSWSTANLDRISHLAFSLTLYMATIGPLAHMQAERRAFWILRTVPVSMGRLLAAKAKAWSLVVGGTAFVAFATLSLGLPHVDAVDWLSAAAVVVAGAVAVTWLAIPLAAGAADLSDEQRPVIGPATIYTFLFIGGLYNVVVAGNGVQRAAGFGLYALAIAATWREGVARANVCFDAEAVRARRLTLGDGAAFVIALSIGQRAAAMGAEVASLAGPVGTFIGQVIVPFGVGLVAAVYLARRPDAGPRLGLASSLARALCAGTVGGAFAQLGGGHAFLSSSRELLAAFPIFLCEELVFRGIVQRGLAEARPLSSDGQNRWLAAVASVTLAVMATSAAGGTGAYPLRILIVSHAVAALTKAKTGRTLAAVVARACAAGTALALGRLFF
ncbi:MAG: family intrarane metalloprotease protein [Myxococcales bacterium]|nr:family intrarane metalloprotease protein [Myxococcales bacterium]